MGRHWQRLLKILDAKSLEVQGQAEWSFEQPDLVEDAPAYGRKVWNKYSLMSLSNPNNSMILWLNMFGIKNEIKNCNFRISETAISILSEKFETFGLLSSVTEVK